MAKPTLEDFLRDVLERCEDHTFELSFLTAAYNHLEQIENDDTEEPQA